MSIGDVKEAVVRIEVSRPALHRDVQAMGSSEAMSHLDVDDVSLAYRRPHSDEQFFALANDRSRGRARRVRHDRRTERLRQEQPADADRRAAAADERARSVSTVTPVRSAGLGSRAGLPGFRAPTVAHGPAQRRARDWSSRGSPAAERRTARARAHRDGRAARLRTALSAPALGRDAPARRDRASTQRRAGSAAHGRTVRRARRADPRS